MLLEQAAAESGDVGDGGDGDAGRLAFGEGRFFVERRNIDFLETELFGFGDAAFDLADRTDLATETHFGGEADLR